MDLPEEKTFRMRPEALISNAPAKSASSAELRRSRIQLSRVKAHVKVHAVFRARKQNLLAEEDARFDFSLGIYCPSLALATIL